MKKKICFVVTLELSVRVFLADHMRHLQEIFDLTLVVNTTDSHFLEPYDIRAHVIPLDISRNITPFHDFICLVSLYRIFRNGKFDIVHSVMPKSGLLAMTGSFLARVPMRIHTFTGQFWKNLHGIKRFVLKSIDKLIITCASHILVDSPSQREYLIAQGVVDRSKSSVVGQGSICGVDIERFAYKEEARLRIRKMLEIPDEAMVFLFLGRITRDKGVLDLAQAFSGLCERYPLAHLIIAGPDEGDLSRKIGEICFKCRDRVRFKGFVEKPEEYMSAADVFCLPSYREGFGQVIAEAAAAGIPSIGSNIYGITDTIEDGINGFLFEPGAWHELRQKMTRFLEYPDLVKIMGTKARQNTIDRYSKNKVVLEMSKFYAKLINAKINI